MRQEYEAQIETLKKEQRLRIQEGKKNLTEIRRITLRSSDSNKRPTGLILLFSREEVSPAEITGGDRETPG